MYNDYGRWHFYDSVGSEPEFVTRPAIRATNTSGAFAVELSHTAEIKHYDNEEALKVINHTTGVIQIIVSDR